MLCSVVLNENKEGTVCSNGVNEYITNSNKFRLKRLWFKYFKYHFPNNSLISIKYMDKYCSSKNFNVSIVSNAYQNYYENYANNTYSNRIAYLTNCLVSVLNFSNVTIIELFNSTLNSLNIDYIYSNDTYQIRKFVELISLLPLEIKISN